MSTVVYLSNVPSFCQEQDVYRALLTFGSATEVQLNHQNGSAAVTMRTPHEAQALRNHHTVNIMGSMVSVNASGMPPQAPSAPQQPQQVQPSYGGAYQSGGMGGLAPQNTVMGGARTRLRFVVENCTYPVTRPLLLQLFNMVAQPTHVYCGPPGPTTAGDVEFQDQQTADRVLQELNNKYIYPDCCLMRLYYDQQPAPRMAPQPTMAMQTPPQHSMLPQQQQQQQQQQQPHMAPQQMNQSPYGHYDPMLGGAMQMAQHGQDQQQPQQQMGSPPPPQQQQQPMGMPYGGQPPFMYDNGYGSNNSNNNPQMNMSGYDGNGMAMGSMPNNSNTNMMMMTQPGPAFRGGRGMGRGGPGMAMRGRGGRGDGMMFDPMAGQGYGQGYRQGYEQGPGGFIGGGRGGGPGDAGPPPPAQPDGTVMVSNVAETVPLYDLWVLLEVYGNVNSLKRMFKEKTSVVAQFQHPVDARNAVFNLHGCRFRGHALALKHFAGYVERGRVEWNAGPATDPSTQAVLFTSGFHHRTKPNAPFNAQGRVHPEKYLYVSNLTSEISDDAVRSLLSSTKEGDAPRQVVQFYRKNDAAAIAEFVDVEASVDALIASHAKQIKDRYLRVTFSRHPPGPRAQPEKAENHEEGHAGPASTPALPDGAPSTEEAPATTPASASAPTDNTPAEPASESA